MNAKLRRQLLALLWMAGILLSVPTVHCAADGSRENSGTSADRLLERINSYYSLFAQEKYGEAYEMLAQEWRKGDTDREEWVDYASQMGRVVKIKNWSVDSISTLRDRAKVAISVEVETNDTTKLERVIEVQFWQLEHGDWFHIPLQLSDWNDAEATAIPLRQKGV